MKRVYIAGAYSADSLLGMLRNIRQGIEKAVELMQMGYAPFCPFLDFQYGLKAEAPLEVYQEASLEWMKASDVVYVLPGWEHSKGTINEMRLAQKIGIPVVFSVGQLAKVKLKKRGKRNTKVVYLNPILNKDPLQERIDEYLAIKGISDVIVDCADLVMRTFLYKKWGGKDQGDIAQDDFNRLVKLMKKGHVNSLVYKVIELGELIKCKELWGSCKYAKDCWVTRRGFCKRRDEVG
jgi:hypothetical protein